MAAFLFSCLKSTDFGGFHCHWSTRGATSHPLLCSVLLSLCDPFVFTTGTAVLLAYLPLLLIRFWTPVLTNLHQSCVPITSLAVLLQAASFIGGESWSTLSPPSLQWFKGISTGNHGLLSSNIGVSNRWESLLLGPTSRIGVSNRWESLLLGPTSRKGPHQNAHVLTKEIRSLKVGMPHSPWSRRTRSTKNMFETHAPPKFIALNLPVFWETRIQPSSVAPPMDGGLWLAPKPKDYWFTWQRVGIILLAFHL